ncbi:MAG: Gfo/Idh/MocA family protein, partial [Solirubrobacteraceae bacterium]
EFLAAVDIVDIGTPTHLHVSYALAAAAAGKPTLCEKPLALDSGSGRRVVEAFEAAGVPLQVAHILRYSPEYILARARVEAGEIGEPAVLRLSRRSFAPKRAGHSWFADESKSGGIVFDLMIHDLDYARWIAGDVTSVYAKSSSTNRAHAVAILKHERGAVSHVESSWSLPAPHFRTEFEIAGSEGIIQFSSEKTAPLDVRLHDDDGGGDTGLGDTELAANPFEAEMRAFLDQLDGAAPVMSAGDALAAVRVAAAVDRSLATGLPVAIEKENIR